MTTLNSNKTHIFYYLNRQDNSGARVIGVHFFSLCRSFWSARSRSEILETRIYIRAVFTSPTRNIARTSEYSLFFGYEHYLTL